MGVLDPAVGAGLVAATVAALGMIPVDRVTEGLSGPTVDVLPAAFRHRT
jgi:hypothetical protein